MKKVLFVCNQGQENERGRIRNFLFAALVIQVFLNCRYELKDFSELLSYLKQGKVIRPGESFAGLRPYLQGVLTAGYVTCDKSAQPMIDANIMAPYQQAQFILSPTVLDFNSLAHDFIILQCSNPDRRLAYLRKLPDSRILYQNAGTMIMKRKK